MKAGALCAEAESEAVDGMATSVSPIANSCRLHYKGKSFGYVWQNFLRLILSLYHGDCYRPMPSRCVPRDDYDARLSANFRTYSGDRNILGFFLRITSLNYRIFRR